MFISILHDYLSLNRTLSLESMLQPVPGRKNFSEKIEGGELRAKDDFGSACEEGASVNYHKRTNMAPFP
jgi:hypothetical protein